LFAGVGSAIVTPGFEPHPMPIWTPEQDQALTAVARWLETPGARQVFRLFGFAGTGKSTLARHLAEHVEGDVAFAAFTGKAALVMRSKGCKDARTIHSLIYRATDTETEEPSFVLNDDSAAARAKLIVVDECSMVDEELGRDLLSFGKKVLVLGDPAQLPPVKGGGFFTEAEPDVMLKEVHRQAADNPIIRLSMAIRAGESVERGVFGDTRVISRDALDPALVTGADQVLVGLNKTRRAYNGRLRQLRGFTGDLPQSGEKLVCLRNNRKKGLLNGALFTVKSAGALRRGKVRMLVTPEDGEAGKFQRVAVVPQLFGAETDIPYALRKDSDEFDFGYALTVHKAQGSQWDDVTLFDESFAFREHRARWLYTGVTRAAKRLTLVM
jgi:exodeoxyribonuclease-5